MEEIEQHDSTEERKRGSNASIVVVLVIFLLGALGFGAWFLDPFGWFVAEPVPSPSATASVTDPATATAATSSSPSVTPSATSAPTSFELDAAALAERVALQIPETGSVTCPGWSSVVVVKVDHNAFCDFVPADNTATHYLVTVTFDSLTSATDYTFSFLKATTPSMALAPEMFATQLGRAIWDKYGGDAQGNCGTNMMWIADGLEYQGCTVTGYRADGTRFAPEVELTFSDVDALLGTYKYAWTVRLVRTES